MPDPGQDEQHVLHSVASIILTPRSCNANIQVTYRPALKEPGGLLN